MFKNIEEVYNASKDNSGKTGYSKEIKNVIQELYKELIKKLGDDKKVMTVINFICMEELDKMTLRSAEGLAITRYWLKTIKNEKGVIGEEKLAQIQKAKNDYCYYRAIKKYGPDIIEKKRHEYIIRKQVTKNDPKAIVMKNFEKYIIGLSADPGKGESNCKVNSLENNLLFKGLMKTVSKEVGGNVKLIDSRGLRYTIEKGILKIFKDNPVPDKIYIFDIIEKLDLGGEREKVMRRKKELIKENIEIIDF